MLGPKVSIVIPLYNKEAWILETLRSVAIQTYPHWECIIVDDGSTDSSKSLVKGFIETHQGDWKLIEQENAGQAVARNRGISESRGKYVAFLDADDLWLSTKLEQQVKHLLSNEDCLGLLSSYAIFSQGDSSFREIHFKSVDSMLLGWSRMTGFGGLTESTGIFDRETLLKCGGFDLKFSTSGGLDFLYRFKAMARIEVLEPVLTFYRISGSQFHEDHDALKRNLEILRRRLESEKDLARYHLAYFYCFDLRESSIVGVISYIFKLIFDVSQSKYRVLMLGSLIKRNIAAKIQGTLHKSYLQGELERLEKGLCD